MLETTRSCTDLAVAPRKEEAAEEEEAEEEEAEEEADARVPLSVSANGGRLLCIPFRRLRLAQKFSC